MPDDQLHPSSHAGCRDEGQSCLQSIAGKTGKVRLEGSLDKKGLDEAAELTGALST